MALSLSGEAAKGLGEEPAALGYRGETDGSRTVWTGPGVRFTVGSTNGREEGIVAIEMSLVRRPATDPTVALGPRARLEVRRNATARLSF